MHRGHDHHDHGAGGHSHSHGHSHGHAHGHSHGPSHSHNGLSPKPAAQWQTPHLPEPPVEEADHVHAEPDLDLVEKAFVESFGTASDPTSFLRLARVPFEAIATDGTRITLLRVETDDVTDVGTVMPHLGGGSFRYDPLPAAMVSRRRRLRFVYFDGKGSLALSLAQVRMLAET